MQLLILAPNPEHGEILRLRAFGTDGKEISFVGSQTVIEDPHADSVCEEYLRPCLINILQRMEELEQPSPEAITAGMQPKG